MSIVDKIMFVSGPASAVFPIFSFVVYPVMITAPGEMILNSGVIMDMSVSSAPSGSMRNSAGFPWSWAVVLWASSCSRNDVVRVRASVVAVVGVSVVGYMYRE